MSRSKTKNYKRFTDDLNKRNYLDVSETGLKIKLEHNEKFIQVIGYPDYWISNYGRLISCKRGKYKLIKKQINGAGYPQYTLCMNGHCEQITAHRLVGEAFVKGFDPDYRNEIHHSNHEKLDSYFLNLIWLNKVHHSFLDRDYKIFYLSNYENSSFVPVTDLVEVADKIGIDIDVLGFKLKEEPDQIVNDMELYAFDSSGKKAYYIGIVKPDKNPDTQVA